jgi:DNA-binding NtrC family response regulator
VVSAVDRTVLVVDDDDDWRALVADLLADAGYVVATAGDGRAACDCLNRMTPDVIITDVEMPFMNGSELVAELRCRGRGIPVIVMTADDAPDAALAPAAFRLIRKPAAPDEVVTAVKEALLGRRQARLRALLRAARAAVDGRGRFAVMAGVGVAAAAAVLIAAVRAGALRGIVA